LVKKPKQMREYFEEDGVVWDIVNPTRHMQGENIGQPIKPREGVAMVLSIPAGFMNGAPLISYLSVKLSTIPGAGHGLFTLVDLDDHALVGWYCGKSRKNTSNKFHYQFKDVDAMGTVGHHLAFGMHVMNDPTLGLTGEACTQAISRVNVHMYDDYGCRVNCRDGIKAGSELFTQYEPSNASRGWEKTSKAALKEFR